KETLFSIAKRYSARIDEIRAANPDMGDAIKAGQRLRIPYKGVVQNLPGTLPSADGKKYKSHTVEKKETVYAISKKYNVPAEEIIKANPGIENGLKEGQVIRIPEVAVLPQNNTNNNTSNNNTP